MPLSFLTSWLDVPWIHQIYHDMLNEHQAPSPSVWPARQAHTEHAQTQSSARSFWPAYPAKLLHGHSKPSTTVLVALQSTSPVPNGQKAFNAKRNARSSVCHEAHWEMMMYAGIQGVFSLAVKWMLQFMTLAHAPDSCASAVLFRHAKEGSHQYEVATSPTFSREHWSPPVSAVLAKEQAMPSMHWPLGWVQPHESQRAETLQLHSVAKSSDLGEIWGKEIPEPVTKHKATAKMGVEE